MKSYIKGIITGFLISAMVFAIPVVAENIDALFNDVRINVNGVDEIQWGENIELDNGETTPSSILYNGTTYLPMRKLGELSGNKIYWDGDSRTVSMTGSQKDIEVIAEKPDKNGNVWKYYTFKVSEYNSHDKQYYDVSYLGIKDEVRGYERVYQICSDDIGVSDDAIYFMKLQSYGAWDPLSVDSYDSKYGPYSFITKIPFENDENSQDGEKIEIVEGLNRAYIDDEYIYYVWYASGNARGYSVVTVYNYLTGESWDDDSQLRGSEITDFEIIENNEENVKFSYKLHTPVGVHETSKTFDKTGVNLEGWTTERKLN